jgi:hypothetical protein
MFSYNIIKVYNLIADLMYLIGLRQLLKLWRVLHCEWQIVQIFSYIQCN